MIPSFKRIEISMKGDTCVLLGVKWLKLVTLEGSLLLTKLYNLINDWLYVQLYYTIELGTICSEIHVISW